MVAEFDRSWKLEESSLTYPLRWRKPIRARLMGDLFHESITDEWIDKIFAVMALCPQHTFQVLTKRAERMRDYVASLYKTTAWIFTAGQMVDRGLIPPGLCIQIKEPLPNVWLGVSCERQQEADERIPLLLQTPAAVRFISAEPLLGPIDLRSLNWDREPGHYRKWFVDVLRGDVLSSSGDGGPIPKLDWVIVGGESGPHARPMHPDWARALRDQCAAGDVPFFFKQWGEHGRVGDQRPAPDHLPEDADLLTHVGKKAAGRLLDGRKHNEFPQ